MRFINSVEHGFVEAVKLAHLKKISSRLPSLQRDWDNDVIGRYDVGEIGGLATLSPSVFTYTVCGRRVRREALLVSGLTQGTDVLEFMVPDLLYQLRQLGIPAVYDRSMAQEVSRDELLAAAAVEIARLRVRTYRL